MKEQTSKSICISTAIMAAMVSTLLLALFLWVKSYYVKTIELTLQSGETYEIGSETPEERDYASLALTTFTSTDETVATLLSGYRIVAQSPGEATLTLSRDGKTIRYHVLVTEDDERYSSYYFVRHDPSLNNPARIGLGVNGLQVNEVNRETVTRGPVLDWEKLMASGHLYYDETHRTVWDVYGGSSFSDFQTDLMQKNEYEISVKIFGKKFTAKKEYMQLAAGASANVEIWGQINYKAIQGSYYLEWNRKLLNEWLDEEAREALYGPKARSPRLFFLWYGTHIILGGDFGGSAVYSYRISNNVQNEKEIDSRREAIMEWYDVHEVLDHFEERTSAIVKDKRVFSMDYQELKGILGVNKISFASAGKHIDGWRKDWVEGNLLVSSYMTVIGSNIGLSDEWGDGESATDPYTAIMMMKKLGEYDLSMYTEDFIGLRDAKSLYPVWDLIPQDSPENIARRTELINYYYSHIQK